jgi:hypothetical protein
MHWFEITARLMVLTALFSYINYRSVIKKEPDRTEAAREDYRKNQFRHYQERYLYGDMNALRVD